MPPNHQGEPHARESQTDAPPAPNPRAPGHLRDHGRLQLARGGSSGPSSEASSGASQPAASQPAASSGGSGDGSGGANGSITYQVSGDYTASGELPFVSLALSTFTNGGWVAYFGQSTGDTVIQLSTNPASLIANFGNPEVSIPGTKDNGCTFNVTKNDSRGLAGSFECHGVQGLRTGTTTLIHVDFSGNFEGHP